MPYPAILRDTNGDPIPQYFNAATTTWMPLTEAEITALNEVDISDDAARLLGIVASIASTVDVTQTGKGAAAFESITTTSTAIGFSTGTVGTYRYGFITCETAQVRFRVDGTAPTTAEGHLIGPSDVLTLDSNDDLLSFRVRGATTTPGVLKATFSGVA